MTYIFDGEIASIVGVNAAVIFQNIGFWVSENEANGRNCEGGRYWTYNSNEAYRKLFPFLSANQIRGALDKLSDYDLILTGCFNKDARDRTSWYTLSDIGKQMWDKKQMHLLNSTNGDAENHRPLPYINTDIEKKEISKDISKEKKRFTPPTLSEVEAYIKEKGYHFNAKAFFDYYASANWHKSDGKAVKNWKQCCALWESNRKDETPQKSVNDDRRKRLE